MHLCAESEASASPIWAFRLECAALKNVLQRLRHKIVLSLLYEFDPTRTCVIAHSSGRGVRL
jgi:hypothetical protein